MVRWRKIKTRLRRNTMARLLRTRSGEATQKLDGMITLELDKHDQGEANDDDAGAGRRSKAQGWTSRSTRRSVTVFYQSGVGRLFNDSLFF